LNYFQKHWFQSWVRVRVKGLSSELFGSVLHEYISLDRYLKGDQNPFKTFKNPLEEPEIQAPRTNLKK
jgi:hypothetical protein